MATLCLRARLQPCRKRTFSHCGLAAEVRLRIGKEHSSPLKKENQASRWVMKKPFFVFGMRARCFLGAQVLFGGSAALQPRASSLQIHNPHLARSEKTAAEFIFCVFSPKNACQAPKPPKTLLISDFRVAF
jgi:hypothetical protein